MEREVRKRGICLMIGLFFSLGFNAQNAVLEGRIYSRQSFENISHANLILKNSDGLVVTSITTGYDGYYKTDSLNAGAYRLEVLCKDHQLKNHKIVYLQSGKSVRMDISMDETEDSEKQAGEKLPPGITREKERKNLRFFEVLGDIVKTGMIAGF